MGTAIDVAISESTPSLPWRRLSCGHTQQRARACDGKSAVGTPLPAGRSLRIGEKQALSVVRQIDPSHAGAGDSPVSVLGIAAGVRHDVTLSLALSPGNAWSWRRRSGLTA